MRYLFVGEQRSELAKRMNVRWRDGRLAAVPLFDALTQLGIDPLVDCIFTNAFERGNVGVIRLAYQQGLTIVAMGKKAQGELERRRVPHLKMVHPAARGRIRKRERYIAHVAEVLAQQLAQV